MNTNDLKKHIEWEKYYDPNFDWNRQSFYKNNHLTEDFIREFKDKVNWTYISIHTYLSEDFIREFKDKVNWFWIPYTRRFSQKFMDEFDHIVDWADTFDDKEIVDEMD